MNVDPRHPPEFNEGRLLCLAIVMDVAPIHVAAVASDAEVLAAMERSQGERLRRLDRAAWQHGKQTLHAFAHAVLVKAGTATAPLPSLEQLERGWMKQ